MKNASLTDLLLFTLTSEIEIFVNTHQLIYLSKDYEDLESLTANHLLIGGSFYSN